MSPSEQPAGTDRIDGAPRPPLGWPTSSVSRSYCTPGGKSAAPSTTLSNRAPGQVAVPAVWWAQPASVAANSASTA
ncbi:hypothetical protein BHQ17_16455 [Mycolicibacterium holsaticum]|uniref:Uncharacterized protein n=1 Tax=Mycolicibacterium holsaticum TaxID=152142 RepID=A0A1E3RQE1_9MYCO|nr:hypothetical protein BHQ17_16455 [Mycolicibacterium holsaticum]